MKKILLVALVLISMIGICPAEEIDWELKCKQKDIEIAGLKAQLMNKIKMNQYLQDIIRITEDDFVKNAQKSTKDVLKTYLKNKENKESKKNISSEFKSK